METAMGEPHSNPSHGEGSPTGAETEGTADAPTGRSRSKRPLVLAAITVVALVLAGAGAWGVMTVRDNRLTSEAQDILKELHAQEQVTRAVLAGHLERIDEGQGWLPDLESSEEMLQARSELFDDEVHTAFTDAVAKLTETTASPAADKVQVDPLFDADSGAFVEQYRTLRAEEREDLARASDEAVTELQELTQTLHAADAEIDAAVEGAETAVQELLADLPARAEAIAADYPEAEEDAVLTLHGAGSGEQGVVEGVGEEADGAEEAEGEEVTAASGPADGEDADPALIAEQVAALPELLIVYIESADGVRDSHEHVVAEREAEEE